MGDDLVLPQHRVVAGAMAIRNQRDGKAFRDRPSHRGICAIPDHATAADQPGSARSGQPRRKRGLTRGNAAFPGRHGIAPGGRLSAGPCQPAHHQIKTVLTSASRSGWKGPSRMAFRTSMVIEASRMRNSPRVFEAHGSRPRLWQIDMNAHRAHHIHVQHWPANDAHLPDGPVTGGDE